MPHPSLLQPQLSPLYPSPFAASPLQPFIGNVLSDFFQHIGAGACLFSWKENRDLFLNGPFEFRIIEVRVGEKHCGGQRIVRRCKRGSGRWRWRAEILTEKGAKENRRCNSHPLAKNNRRKVRREKRRGPQIWWRFRRWFLPHPLVAECSTLRLHLSLSLPCYSCCLLLSPQPAVTLARERLSVSTTE